MLLKELMKNVTTILVFLIVGTGIFFLKKNLFSPKQTELPKFGNYLSCIGVPFDFKVKFKSDIYLLKEAAPEDEKKRNALYFSAAYFQNMYSFTNLHDYNQFQQNIKWSALSEKEPKIKITKVEESTYPINVDVPSDVELIAFPEGPTSYVNKLKSIGHVKKGEPAYKVSYEYENDLLMCFTDNKPDLSKLKIVHPLDPYTAYFIVPVSERKLFSNDSREGAKHLVNPCLDPEILSPTAFYPFYFWYAWRPFAEGHDLNRTAFNCKDYYKVGESIQNVSMSYSENKPRDVMPLDFTALEKLERPIEIAVYLGSQESLKFKKLNKEDGERYIKRYLSEMSSLEAKNELPTHQGKYDIKFSTMLWFMRNVAQQMDLKKSSYEVDEYFAKVELKGKLKLSHRDAIIKIFLVQTNPKVTGAEQFAKSFSDEFLNTDVVTYEGHVANGTVFLDSLNKHRENMIQKMDKNLNYQIFALYSCTANFFFNPESFPSVANDNFHRDIIRTGGSYIDGSANSSLALIGQIDSYLYNKRYVHFSNWSKLTKSDNFYILSNH